MAITDKSYWQWDMFVRCVRKVTLDMVCGGRHRLTETPPGEADLEPKSGLQGAFEPKEQVSKVGHSSKAEKVAQPKRTDTGLRPCQPVTTITWSSGRTLMSPMSRQYHGKFKINKLAIRLSRRLSRIP